MSTNTITLAFCFLAFLCGQFFHATLHPSSIVKTAAVPEVVVVIRGFSLVSLIFVIVAVLVVHDSVILLLLHHLGKSDASSRSESTRLVSKSLMAAAGNVHRPRRLTLLLLPPMPPNDHRPPPHSMLIGPPRSIWVLPFFKMHRGGVPLIPRPFWTRAIYQQRLGLRAALPLLEQSPALALAPKLSRSLTFASSIASGHQDEVPLFRRLLEHLAAGDTPVTELGFEKDNRMESIDISSGIEQQVEEEAEYRDTDLPKPDAPEDEEASLDDSPTQSRPSQAPFLLHIAASALLRRLQFRVVEEVSYASIEEVVEEVEAGDHMKVEEDAEEDAAENVKEIVENVKEPIEVEIVEEAAELEKEAVKNVKAAAEIAEDNVKETEVEKEPVENVKEPVEECVKKTVEEAADVAQLVHETAGKVPVQATPEVGGETETLSIDAMKKYDLNEKEVEGATAERVVPAYDEFDGLPSYEDFVRDLPDQPLFGEWVSAAPAYAIIRPPLSALAERTTTTTLHDARARGSHLGLLGRPSSRVSALSA
ncbi:hypothetical protein DFH06DRAFT_286009 [Mycena polygramma]|nr:hypothetical protein DFH06DRAFT_286009 [Mycena polygramma]